MGGLRRTDYKVIEDIYLDKYLRDVFNEYLKNKKVTIDEKKLKYRNNEVEVAKGILVNRYVALEMHHEYMEGELLKEMRDGKGPTEVLLGAIMVKMVNYLKTQGLKLEGIWQDKFPGGYIDANEILAGAMDVAGKVDAKYEEMPILGHAWQAGKGSALYVYDKSPVWLKAAVDMAILPESLLMTGKLIKNIRKGGSGIELAEAIKVTKVPVTLDLRDNRITDPGAKAFDGAMKDNFCIEAGRDPQQFIEKTNGNMNR
jgi:hypothetical protein